jgi:hypothetical protein
VEQLIKSASTVGVEFDHISLPVMEKLRAAHLGSRGRPI